jgi:hypothetical protein
MCWGSSASTLPTITMPPPPRERPRLRRADVPHQVRDLDTRRGPSSCVLRLPCHDLGRRPPERPRPPAVVVPPRSGRGRNDRAGGARGRWPPRWPDRSRHRGDLAELLVQRRAPDVRVDDGGRHRRGHLSRVPVPPPPDAVPRRAARCRVCARHVDPSRSGAFRAVPDRAGRARRARGDKAASGRVDGRRARRPDRRHGTSATTWPGSSGRSRCRAASVRPCTRRTVATRPIATVTIATVLTHGQTRFRAAADVSLVLLTAVTSDAWLRGRAPLIRSESTPASASASFESASPFPGVSDEPSWNPR